MSGKKILMLVGEFSEEYEIFVFEQAMHAVGHVVHVVCPDKKAGEAIKTSLHDFEGDQTYTEKPGHFYTLNKSFSEVDPAQYDAVYCAGGRGPEYIRINPRVQRIVKHFHEAGKPIFTICHGVQILVAVDGVVRGRRVAALHFAPLLRARGATRRRDLRRRRAHRRLRRRQPGLGQGLARARRLHARVPEGAGHRDQPPLTPDRA
jgi:putative intracellular protease/amidase